MGSKLVGDSAGPHSAVLGLVGSLMSDILEGVHWSEISDGAEQDRNRSAWGILTALLAATPCHVARDGTMTRRHEARACAAAMWAVRGNGTPSEAGGGPSGLAVRPPLAIGHVCSAQASASPLSCSSKSGLGSLWGTMDPSLAAQGGPGSIVPFRPGVACGFLFMPILAWDLNTLAGAVFTLLLVSGNETSKHELGEHDLLLAARTLLVGRLVQALIVPGGFDIRSVSADDALIDLEEFWTEEEIVKEADALFRLHAHCRETIGLQPVDLPSRRGGSFSGAGDAAQFFAAVGLAILPFARTLVLLLRAGTSAVRRRRGGGVAPDGDAIIKALLGSGTMSHEDGLGIMKAMGGPLPSVLCEIRAGDEGHSAQLSSWSRLIDRWLVAVRTLEQYHGSRGDSLIHDVNSGTLVPFQASADAMTTGYAAKLSGSGPAGGTGVQVVEAEAGSAGDQNDGTDGEERAGRVRLEDPNYSVDMEDVTPLDNIGAGDEGYAYGSDEDEDMGHEDSVDGGEAVAFEVGGVMMDEEDESDEEMIEDVVMEANDEDEEGINLDTGADGRNVVQGVAMPVNNGDVEARYGDEPYDNSSCDSSSGGGSPTSQSKSDGEFANVSRSSILQFQPSLLGLSNVGPGPRGARFEYATAYPIMSDLSHLGMVHRQAIHIASLIRLPHSFVELYGLVNKVKGRDSQGTVDEQDDATSTETAICLLTGAIMSSGSSRRHYTRSTKPPGSCTLHARRVGSGIGIFFLVQKCTVLLVHNNKSAYSASLYVDEHGEEDPGLRRGRPLFLKDERYEALEALWRRHGIPREVAQIRSTSDRVIRDNWY
eukprot:CAMPEP_0183300090 /NCGR_PEP_ID=MMETSP0160_2-20130417/6622_1 /TAXON_ID=2839 ORGANISM="Odontella Sinensis, Strain Grunow 1884" /NCGR_SAMPLE_ID=MMETSP0160_2 /ASSEMBLY_ACC=CAM_ASM_000250 /LENGTH=821 /DNA_ID=CAMNT_0025462449 /DNA_START=1 /DNA_END=2466 /DNA_ORIENTATION=+